jgi:predicted phage terminase large subunit-like protein
LEELAKLKKGVGSRAWAARFQGEPKPDEGTVLNSAKLVMVEPENVPEMVRTVRRWDLAFSDKSAADWCAGAKLGKAKNGDVYILHMRRVKGKWPQSKPIIIETAQQDGQQCSVYIEANGTQLGYYDDIKAHPTMRNRAVYPDVPEGNKEMRASLWGTRLDDGIIHCVRGEWNGELFDEMDYFPNGDNDDMVDAISGGWDKLSKTSRILVA